MTYHDISWHIMTYHDISWHIMTYHDISWGGSMAEWLEREIYLKSSRSRAQIPFWPLADVVLCSPGFNISSMLINSQLICLPPVEIVNRVMFQKSLHPLQDTPFRAKYGSIYSWDTSGFGFASEFWWEKITCHFFFSQESLWTTHLVTFVKINLLKLGYIKEINTVCINSFQTMSDKSSWDAFRKSRFSILQHFFYYICI